MYEQITQTIKGLFNDTVDFEVKQVDIAGVTALLCYYATLIDSSEANRQIGFLDSRAKEESGSWGSSSTSTVYPFSQDKLIEEVCMGSAVLIFPETNMMIGIQVQKTPERSPEEPINEQVIRGSHQGLIEDVNKNIGIIRKRLQRSDLVVKKFQEENTKAQIHMVYLKNEASPEVVNDLEQRLFDIPFPEFYSVGQLEDYLEDQILSPFPQWLNTERPDRVVYNLLEGKISVFIDSSPTALIAPVSFFAFYESPDDYNSRVIVGSFYRMVRLLAFFVAILLPSFYISIVSFHSEVLPLDLSKHLQELVKDVPYRPLLEALLLELFIELIREASVRLPQRIGQTVGIVGGIIIGDAIVTSGLVTNLMVIVVAMTAIASFSVPAIEMNMAIRILRFPFMLLAASFGFLGMVIGTLLLFIHLLNLSSLRQPYLTPIVPFDPSRFRNIFFRIPYFRPDRQQSSFNYWEDRDK
ncbi:spore germination protein [Edaphobacillus lindanitolerans]|uniref:Spore germination protein KA n=1 Tax=Edaphobacillus lindanitolerans TaxID=550447 RepID=A0A1U7PLF8_9BACI|nr:spore germination protein [Edaphobacillus lindanitolerans]SIT80684.1 spore germination protein KA [Edaphobacillus lindanitolerans]